MNNIELEALRRHLFFSVAEASRLISGTSERAWRMWESGQRRVPEDVAGTLMDLAAWRNTALTEAQRAIIEKKQAASRIALIWYPDVESWLSFDDDAIYWRPHCSVVAELAAKHHASIVCFDMTTYARWLKDRTDSKHLRSQWAAELSLNPSR